MKGVERNTFRYVCTLAIFLGLERIKEFTSKVYKCLSRPHSLHISFRFYFVKMSGRGGNPLPPRTPRPIWRLTSTFSATGDSDVIMDEAPTIAIRGRTSSDPVIVHLFSRNYNSRIVQKTRNSSGAWTSNWIEVTGSQRFISPPAVVSRTSTTLDLFAIG